MHLLLSRAGASRYQKPGMWRGARIAVVVPSYREASLVGTTLRGIPAFVDQVYVVDDASPDQTSSAALAVGDPRVDCLRHETNQGVGAAIRTGYRAAVAAGADVVAVMAGDNQMDPGDLPRVIEPVVVGVADYVKGNRFLHPEVARMPRGRRLAGRFLAAVTRLGTGLVIDDSQCGYTAASAAALRRVPLEELWPRYGYPNDLLGLLAGAQLRVVEVPVRPVYAREQSGVRFWHVGTICWLVVRRWWRSRTDLTRQRTTESD